MQFPPWIKTHPCSSDNSGPQLYLGALPNAAGSQPVEGFQIFGFHITESSHFGIWNPPVGIIKDARLSQGSFGPRFYIHVCLIGRLGTVSVRETGIGLLHVVR